MQPVRLRIDEGEVVPALTLSAFLPFRGHTTRDDVDMDWLRWESIRCKCRIATAHIAVSDSIILRLHVDHAAESSHPRRLCLRPDARKCGLLRVHKWMSASNFHAEQNKMKMIFLWEVLQLLQQIISHCTVGESVEFDTRDVSYTLLMSLLTFPSMKAPTIKTCAAMWTSWISPGMWNPLLFGSNHTKSPDLNDCQSMFCYFSLLSAAKRFFSLLQESIVFESSTFNVVFSLCVKNWTIQCNATARNKGEQKV